MFCFFISYSSVQNVFFPNVLMFQFNVVFPTALNIIQKLYFAVSLTLILKWIILLVLLSFVIFH